MLRTISRLPANQVQAWYDRITKRGQPFPGEVAALHDRAVILRLALKP
jgi:hypothetical protein